MKTHKLVNFSQAGKIIHIKTRKKYEIDLKTPIPKHHYKTKVFTKMVTKEFIT